MDANRRCRCEVPLARIVLLECPVREHACRTNFSEVPTKFTFEDAVTAATKIHPVGRRICIKIVTARVVFIEPNAPIALNATVHFVIEERTQVLIAIRAFVESEFAIGVARHYRHILKMT